MLSSDTPPAATVLTLAVATTPYFQFKVIFSKKDSLPLGPKRLPFIGSALLVPRTSPWLTFAQCAKTYGDIVYTDVLGQPLVRSAIYSDCPNLLRFYCLAFTSFRSGYGNTFVLLPYGENWRQQRKIVAQDFSQTGVARYHSLQDTEARNLVCSLLKDSSDLLGQIKRLGTIIIRVTFGHYITGEEDPFLTSPVIAMENFSKATLPGACVVDFLPIPQESGTVLLPNMCSTVLEVNRAPSQEEEDHLVWAASAVMGARLDTNTSTVLIFFLAMMLNPDIQAKAREELDNIVGQDRLPTVQDKASLPYIRSVMTEVLRWHPPGPLGIPHALSKDDIYEGMHVPKGSLMIPNIWYMFHDPEYLPNPNKFDPDRYNNLDSEMDKFAHLVFGFGRRVCPGKLFAEDSLFAIIATVLSTCEILPVFDALGNKTTPDITFSSGTIIFPSEFAVNVKCRSTKALELLSQSISDAEKRV
ncbi:putative monooxygenase [Mycena vulgaris]|nr:putative monooxygenase [Mycena vulgaris]